MWIERIDAFIDQVWDLYPLAGLAVGVVQGAEPVYQHCLGVQDIHSVERITPASLFYMASISKVFVAATVLQLAERGKIELDARVVDYLHYFKLADEGYKGLTITQMLSHRSGMPDHEDDLWTPDEGDDAALERHVRSMQDLRLVCEPGERFYYSNLAYDVLGDLVAKVSNQPFETYLQEHIFQPLGMEASTFMKPGSHLDRVAKPHVSIPHLESSPVYPYQRATAPSGGLHSSLQDLCHWATAHLARGHFQGVQILQPSSFDLLWHPYSQSEEDLGESIGFAWFISSHQGKTVIKHDGGEVGYCTLLSLLPKQSTAVIILSNTFPAPVDLISDGILDILLGAEPQKPKPQVLTQLRGLLEEAQHEEALQRLQDLEVEQPEGFDFDPGQFADIGYILIELRKVQEAINLLQLGLKVDPESDDLLFLLAWAYQENDECTKAIQTLRKCLDLNPNNGFAIQLSRKLGINEYGGTHTCRAG